MEGGGVSNSGDSDGSERNGSGSLDENYANDGLDTVRERSTTVASTRDDTMVDDSDVELKLVPKRTRSTVSRLNDETDHWGAGELDSKEEHMLILNDRRLKDTLMHRLNTFRRNAELCDVVLFVKEREILAHKVVLASISHALFDMFSKDTEELKNTNSTSNGALNNEETEKTKRSQASPPKTGISEQRSSSYYEFAQGDFECFEAIVDFAYTSRLHISNKKVGDLYRTAHCLQVFPVAGACARYLAENLSVNNCIAIRKQANFNNDAFLVGKVDSFIKENFEKVIADSVEFTQLSCIRVRIITNDSRRSDDDDEWDDCGIRLAEKSLDYFHKYPRVSDRIDQQIEALVDKPHLLAVNSEHRTLENLCAAADKSLVGSCEIVQDYKRSGQTKTSASAGHKSNMVGSQLTQHRVTGAKAVNLNASCVANAKYASNESLNSVASTSPSTAADDEIESRLIAVNNNSLGVWIALAVLFRRLVVLSIQLSENDDVIRSLDTESQQQQQQHQKSCQQELRQQQSTDSSTDAETVKTPTVGVAPVGPLSDRQERAGGAEATEQPVKGRRPLPAMGRARCSIGASFLDGRIVIFGGYDRGECLNSVEELEVGGQMWQELPPMLDARGRFDSTVAYGAVYAIAGSNGNTDLRTCERYDPVKRSWEPIASLRKARSHNACTSMNGLIYCLGGSSDQNVLRDCERYDPQTDNWGPIAPLQTPRFQAGCTAWRGFVVLCAGCDRWSCLDTVEAYDPASDTWRYLAKLKTPRRGCAVAVLNDSLYVIGGHDGTQSLSSVEVLDHPSAAEWRLGPSLTTPRANTHAVVVSMPDVLSTTKCAIYTIGGFNGNNFLNSIEVLEQNGESTTGWRSWQNSIPPAPTTKRQPGDSNGAGIQQQHVASSYTSCQQQENNNGSVGGGAIAAVKCSETPRPLTINE